jgi:peptidoglycan/LPS O-acetylase OafA/YrhL
VSYLLKNYSAFVTKFGIHDVFQTTTPFGIATDASAVNGSIWTLRHEILAYGILALLAVFGVLRNARPLVPALAVFFIVLQLVESVYPGTAREINDVLGMSKILPLLSAFFIGATMALYSRTIPLTNGLGVGSILVFLFSWWQGGVFLIGVPAFVYALIWIAAALPVWFQRVGNDGRPDLSYGVYLYGWPVQQFLAYLHVYELGYVLYTLLSIAGSLVLAAGSWFLVERPALSLKDRGPGRGIAHWMSRLPRRAGTRSQLPADPR